MRVPCMNCGEPFYVRELNPRKHCSAKCRDESSEKKKAVVCANCGRNFKYKHRNSSTKYCGPACYHASQKKPMTIDRLFHGTTRTDSGCLNRPWGSTISGYSSFNVDGKTKLAHRVSYEMHYGPIPDGLVVCHKCDNPFCIEPTHLFVGTHKDNTQDALQKNRLVRGEAAKNSKLTDQDVLTIRARHKAGGITAAALAKEYKVSIALMSFVINRQRWTHLP